MGSMQEPLARVEIGEESDFSADHTYTGRACAFDRGGYGRNSQASSERSRRATIDADHGFLPYPTPHFQAELSGVAGLEFRGDLQGKALDAFVAKSSLAYRN
jgi:hypothetical protein